ncbi:perlucin-like [Wyeomyia smithii]|uniref:perlucin-like n=1 Tax=Wyeomyia smithii TaxID=174621 RepID=UPI002467DDE8|nr:perlucin-like [Wyeomyia smithii]
MKQALLLMLFLSSAIYCSDFNLSIRGSIFIVPDVTANWFQAGEYCNSLGMRLAVIDNADENTQAIHSILDAGKFAESTTEIWIGGSNLGQGTDYYWQPTGAKFEETFWGIGEPNNLGGVESCAQLRHTPTQDWHWNDKQCTLARNFVCESTFVSRVVSYALNVLYGDETPFN